MQPMYQGQHPGRRPLWIAIGVLTVLVLALSFTLIQRERSRPPPPSAAANGRPAATSTAPAQPIDTTPIAIADPGGEECKPDNTVYDMTVAALGERASRNATEQPVYLEDFERLVRKFYIDFNRVPEGERQRLMKLLTVGQHLKVRYVVCGNAGSRYLTFLQAAGAG
jgi:hypothetical protein